VSDNDRRHEDWSEKVGRYHALGVLELVRFDADAPEGKRIRIWDRVGEDLVERRLHGDHAESPTLGLHWVVAPIEGGLVGLRVARDPEGRDLVLSPLETTASRLETTASRLETATADLDDANARIRALEAELLARRGA